MKLFIVLVAICCVISIPVMAVTNSADLAVQITSPQTVATNGQLVTYYVMAINNGPENISAEDYCEIQFLPPDGQYDAPPIFSSPNGSIHFDSGGWIVIWNPGAINSGQTLTMTVTVRINTADEALNIAETADVYYSNSNIYDQDSGNNYASLQHIFLPAADLSLEITDEYGGTNTWSTDQGAYQIRIAVSNAGPSVITNMVVTNILPEYATVTVDWPNDSSHYNLNGRVLTWWPGGNYLYTDSAEDMWLNITPTTTGVETVTSTLYCDTDTTSDNNHATHSMTIIPPPITVTLGIEGWDIVPTINRYGTIEYELRVYNDGASDAPNVIVSNTLPMNTIFERSIQSQGTVTTNGQFITWNIGTIAANGGGATNNLFIRPLESGTITNIAEVFSGADINETTNTITVETTDINPGPPICTVMPAVSTNTTMSGAWLVVQIETNNIIASNILVTATVTRGPHMNNSTNVLTQLYPGIPELTNTVALFELEDENGYPGVDRISITGNAGIIPFSAPAEIIWQMMDTQEYSAGTSSLISNGLNRYTIEIDDSFDIYKASIGLLFYHSWPENLKVRLISPDNVSITLWNEVAAMDPGAADGMWVGSSNQYCIIDDDAGTNIAAGAEPFAGEYRTETLSLSNLVGEFSQGTWTLEIQDMYPEDFEGGTLYNWGIELIPDDGDIDDDGMNDEWELANDLDPTNPADANSDSDGDGASSWLEYHTGSSPTNSSDSFSVVSSGSSIINGDEITIEWRSQSNLFYSIEQSTDLMSGFLPIITNIFATPPTNSVVITNSAHGTPYFYKVTQEE